MMDLSIGTVSLLPTSAIKLGALLGEGGEGKVFEVADDPRLAFKQYHRPLAGAERAKIEALIDMAPENVGDFAAWPLRTVKDPMGRVTGIVMPRIRDAREINVLYSPKARRHVFPSADWRFLIQAALNAAGAFANVHALGCVIGDVNQSSVLVRRNAQVVLIDCDSYQVKTPHAVHLCDVGVPIFTAPELQDEPLDKIERTPNHDAFGLAVLIFHLLFMGRHPFAGRPHESGDLPIEKAIQQYRFAFSADRARVRLDPPPHTLALSALPAEIASMFERAFAPAGAQPQARPSPVEWHGALTALASRLERCTQEPSHLFAPEAGACPWCGIENATGAALFRTRQRPVAAPSVVRDSLGIADIEKLWLNLQRTPPPAPAVEPRLEALMQTASAGAEARRVGVIRRARVYGSAGAGLAAFLSVVFLPDGGLFWACAAGAAAFAIPFWCLDRVGRGAMLRIVGMRDAAHASWDQFLARWRAGATSAPFDALMARLAQLRAEYARLAGPLRKKAHDRETAHQRATQDWARLMSARAKALSLRADPALLSRYPMSAAAIVATGEEQLARYLDQFTIAKATIPDVGPGRAAKLASYGIETAADITQAALANVPGFGDHLTKRLLGWRKDVERGFRFDPAAAKAAIDAGAVLVPIGPTKPPPPKLEGRTATRLKQIEAEFSASAPRLAQFANVIEAQRKRLHAEAIGLASQVAQAEADAKAVSVFGR
jgi:DNA-binding helix-hairpin-helix protein with protein kinase domain